MSDKDKDKDESKNYEMPEGIPAPPLPQPDSFDLKDLHDDAGKKADKKGKKGKKKDKSHPTDLYNQSRKMSEKGGKKGCGCFGCFGIIVLLLIIGVAVGGYFVAGDVAMSGYKVVSLSNPEETISTAPEEATLYIGQKVTYDAPITDVEIAILGADITFSGDFLEKASFRGAKVTGRSNARFAKELNVIAGQFTDEGVTSNGGVTGRVIQNN